MSVKTTKGYKGVGMDGMIATWYAKNTEKNLEDYRKDALKIAGQIPQGGAVLDLAQGPGYLSIQLAKLGDYKITGLDISAKFVEIAQAKARQAGVNIDFRQGDASDMPFEEATFDFIVCRAAFKNFSQPVQALDEMHRVLKPGGKASIIDLRNDLSSETINRLVADMQLGWIDALITKWTFKHMLVKRAYPKQRFIEFAGHSRFKTCEIVDDPVGLEVRLEKSG